MVDASLEMVNVLNRKKKLTTEFVCVLPHRCIHVAEEYDLSADMTRERELNYLENNGKMK